MSIPWKSLVVYSNLPALKISKMCAEVAAEQDMNILCPEQYQQMMLELKAELQGNKFEQVETQVSGQSSNPE